MGIKIFQNIIPPDKSENRKQERMELMLVRCSTIGSTAFFSRKGNKGKEKKNILKLFHRMTRSKALSGVWK